MNIYLQDVTNLPDPKEDEDMLVGIPEWRKEKILRYTFPQGRKLSLGIWKLLEKALELNGDCARDVFVGENGKLYAQKTKFNLSHSGDKVLCVVSENIIGCDIEEVTKIPVEVCEHCFTQNEQNYIFGGNGEEEKNKRFFKLWTMKESYLKMTGEGITFSPARIEIDLSLNKVFRDGILQPCNLFNFFLQNYEISICEDVADKA
jgi:4'-phosphopantetheinyl transferase